MLPSNNEKRAERDDEVASPSPDTKRQKLEAEEVADSTKVGEHELASAFALASLASLSPQSAHQKRTPEGAREYEHAEDGSTVSWEARSPKDEPVPISPEVRSPIRPNKRVHFAPDIKDVTRSGPRRSSFPPRTAQPQVSRMPPGFARGVYPPRPQIPPPWMRQRMIAPPGFMPPPMMQRPANNQWICDFCNVAAFPTYQEACIHEETCLLQRNIPPRRSPMWHPYAAHQMQLQPQTHATIASVQETRPVLNQLPSAESREWCQGSVSLAVPDSDPEWLSELNCYIRAVCVEAFSAGDEEVARTSKRGRIALNQVGIRCCFCKHCPLEDRAIAAVSYPTSVAGIYESVKRWQRVHLEACDKIPQDTKAKLMQLGNANVWVPTTRQYWADSARALGMVDTADGIRFGSDPLGSPDKSKIEASHDNQVHSREDRKEGSILSDGDYIVYPEDTSMVPPYVYFLMQQVESCHFTEADRFVARSKGPVGYPGFQCRHCKGHAGLGKYFPVSSKSLSTNSTSQNIHAHLLKCRKCPAHIKEQLVTLKEEKSKAPRLEPGWRKVFFDKVWGRLHPEAS